MDTQDLYEAFRLWPACAAELLVPRKEGPGRRKEVGGG